MRLDRSRAQPLMALILAVGLVSASAIPIAASGREAPLNSSSPFEKADRNKDGYVDRGEAAAVPGLSAVFGKSDRDADGRLDKVEYGKALGEIPEDSKK